MKKKWIDLKEIKGEISIEQVLEHFGLASKLLEKGNELVGSCPFCEKDYNKNCFSANVKKNVFQCFACGAKGNVLDFVMLKQGIDIREAGLLLQQWFLGEDAPPPKQEEANPPLTFELKNLDPQHPYLTKERRLKKETIEYFGLGYCKRGMMKDLIVIPIHDEKGQLVAYAGRYPAKEIPDGKVKYKFPPGFKKNLVLYNLHRAKESNEGCLTLVEGFFDVISMWQNGIKNVAALMGTSLSEQQECLLLDFLVKDGKLRLMLDADEAGKNAETEIIKKLINKVYLRVDQD